MVEETLVTGHGIRHIRDGGKRFAITGSLGVMLVKGEDGKASVRMVLADPDNPQYVMMMTPVAHIMDGEAVVLHADSLYSWPLRIDEPLFETGSSFALRVVDDMVQCEIGRLEERGSPIGFLKRVAMVIRGEGVAPVRSREKGWVKQEGGHREEDAG